MFKAGDQIRCVNNKLAEQMLTIGKIYTVKDFETNSHGEMQFLSVVADNDWPHWFGVDRFELVEKETPMKQFKVGDLVKCLSTADGYWMQINVDGRYTVTRVDRTRKEVEIGTANGPIWYPDNLFEVVNSPVETPLDVVKRLFLESTSYAYQDAYGRVLKEAFGVTPVQKTTWVFE